MKKLRNVWEALQSRLRGQEAALKYAQRKHHYWRLKAEAAHKRWEEIKNHPGLGNPDGGVPSFDRARRRWERRHKRSIYWKGRIKRQHQRIHHLQKSIAEIKIAEVKWKLDHGIHWLSENKVRGGTPEQLKVASATRAMRNYQEGKQPGYYSMEGGERDYAHGCYYYASGRVWDCSTGCDAWHYVAGIESPSGHEYKQGGYTATELAESQPIARGHEKPGDLCVFLRYSGDTIGHHVEMLIEKANVPGGWITIGHGDAAIDHSVADAWGDGLYTFRRQSKPCPSLN